MVLLQNKEIELDKGQRGPKRSLPEQVKLSGPSNSKV